jgi:hypothetical protein
MLHIRLDPPEQEGAQYLVQLLDDCVGVRVVLGLEPGIKVLAGRSALLLINICKSKAHLEENTSGRIKFNNAHNSCKLFWSGVPVINSRPRETNVRMI